MKPAPLTPRELALLESVFRHHPEVATVTLFGSRAKGTHTERSDVDLALTGEVDPLRAEAIAAELEELPMPYRFDVQVMGSIHLPTLREHINRVGSVVYTRGPKAA
jgi:predicted nucleotidyltransferase